MGKAGHEGESGQKVEGRARSFFDLLRGTGFSGSPLRDVALAENPGERFQTKRTQGRIGIGGTFLSLSAGENPLAAPLARVAVAKTKGC